MMTLWFLIQQLEFEHWYNQGNKEPLREHLRNSGVHKMENINKFDKEYRRTW
jgi:hypothetical protein